jgi:hypothetical protein
MREAAFFVRLLYTAIAYLGSLIVVTAIAFLGVLFLAGPHGGMLPSSMEPVVLGIGWLTVLGMPSYIGYRVWRKLGQRRTS